MVRNTWWKRVRAGDWSGHPFSLWAAVAGGEIDFLGEEVVARNVELHCSSCQYDLQVELMELQDDVTGNCFAYTHRKAPHALFYISRAPQCQPLNYSLTRCLLKAHAP